MRCAKLTVPGLCRRPIERRQSVETLENVVVQVWHLLLPPDLLDHVLSLRFPCPLCFGHVCDSFMFAFGLLLGSLNLFADLTFEVLGPSDRDSAFVAG